MMKLGVTLANASRLVAPDNAIEMATIAEELGYESLWAVEHTVVPGGYESRYPYGESGKMPGTEESPIADPLIWLSYIAAHTSTIKLATGILILPQRNPLVLAKEISTLDVLSKGRTILGIGVGWLREEFEALGVPFDDRGARSDEYIQVLRNVWLQSEPAFDGKFMSFSNAKSYPKPVQKPVPIVIGGHSEAAARRAGKLGDGFFPFNAGDPAKTLRLFDIARSTAREAGRDPEALELTTSAGLDIETVKVFADAGVTRLIVPPLGRGAEELKRFLGEFAETVSAKLS